MRTFLSRGYYLPLLAVLLVGLFACSSGDTGRLSLSLTDKPTDQYKAVYITIAEIDVNNEADPDDVWTTVATPNQTYDLLALANGVRQELALANLAAGSYSQLRLIIGTQATDGINILGQAHPFANYVIGADDDVHELKVPSGIQTGVKIVKGFAINENQTTELILDFDASRSVVVAGNSGKFLLKPTVKVLETTLASLIRGSVTETPSGGAAAPSGLAHISAELVETLNAVETVVVEASTITDDTDANRGKYELFVAANIGDASYYLVATKEGFAPLAVQLKAEAGVTYTQDFALLAAPAPGTVNLTIAGATEDTYVTIQVLQNVDVGGTPVLLEVNSFNFLNGTFELSLPAGDYTFVATTPDRPSPPAQAVTVGASPVSVTFSFS